MSPLTPRVGKGKQKMAGGGGTGFLQHVIENSCLFNLSAYLAFKINATCVQKKENDSFFTYGYVSFVHVALNFLKGNRETVKPLSYSYTLGEPSLIPNTISLHQLQLSHSDHSYLNNDRPWPLGSLPRASFYLSRVTSKNKLSELS